ncbi:hypothetical protein [Saccharomonospora cyanea]|nr:hypothetical protein [Saccharomonospora cyanea]
MNTQDFPVASLLLDEENPRFEQKVSSQREAINAILSEAPAKLVALAQDIARKGVNPTELPVVTEIDERIVVIEGNRRVAALKLLNNPDLATDAGLRRQFGDAAQQGKGPTSISCVVAESRSDADHWIALRHTGENGGVGIVSWNTEQKYNFEQRRQIRRSKSSQRDRAIIFCNAVSAKFADEADLLVDVAKVRRERLTTLGRLVSDPEVRAALGIDFSEDSLLFHYPHDATMSAVSRLFADLASELSVSQVKSKAQRRQYIGKIEADLPSRSTRLANPESVSPSSTSGSIGSDKTPPIGSTKTPATPTRQRKPQEKYIFQGLRLRNVHLRTADVLHEAQRVEIDSSPNLAAIMLRVVIDIAVTDVADQLGWTKSQQELKERIRAVLNKLDPARSDMELTDARRHSEGDQLLGIKTLHGFVHHWSTHPLTTDIRKLSAAFRPMLAKLDVYLGEHRKS